MMNEEAIQYLPLDSIDEGVRVRDEDDKGLGLARSIQEIGLQQPVRVMRAGDRYVVVEGDRRVRAARLAKLNVIAAIVESKPLSDAEMLHRRLVCELHHVEVSPVARARAIKRLIEESGWQPAEAAGKCGLSHSMLTKLLAVLTLPEPILEQVERSEIPLTSGYVLARVSDAEQQAALARQVAEGTINRDELSEQLKVERRSGKKPDKQNRVTVALTRDESVTVASPRLSLDRLIDVVGSLLDKARQAQARGIELATFVKLLRQEGKQDTVQA